MNLPCPCLAYNAGIPHAASTPAMPADVARFGCHGFPQSPPLLASPRSPAPPPPRRVQLLRTPPQKTSFVPALRNRSPQPHSPQNPGLLAPPCHFDTSGHLKSPQCSVYTSQSRVVLVFE
ncbi:hypothetical protein PTTG_09443 [Puccinia triticina 1-1 BBBD Race 1]|uniref:Uncharacterized protein n=1 Tax=Puccinia triticina (isolate 1-1 / race 1 (BBBD)) TaxID=630390 RepID=A0A0C4F8E7_PUCT1|nr:hypothetical protein PTTG_09443 [Puccinia triticina 1-1 BBBD Race 1]